MSSSRSRSNPTGAGSKSAAVVASSVNNAKKGNAKSSSLVAATGLDGGTKSSMELDSILDAALDEFEAQDMKRQVQVAEKRPLTGDQEKLRSEDEEAAKKKEDLIRMLSSFDDDSYGPVLQNTLKSLSATTEGNETVESLFQQINSRFEGEYQPGFVASGPDDVEGIERADRTIANTLQMLASAQQGMEGFESAKIEDTGEQMMEEMVAQFESLGEKEDYNEVIDGVMRQLLSKDLMYEPTKLICSKFPEWLATHRGSLPTAEYNNYGKLYQCFQKILAVYDTEPDNFPRLMELMYDMQQYGQPPAEIIKDLAPGLKFDENGMPIMPNMGAGMAMPGGEGYPDMTELAGRMGSGQCCLM